MSKQEVMSLALMSISESVKRCFPLIFKKIGENSVILKYKGKSLIFSVKKLVNIGDDDIIEKIAIDYQGLSTVVAEVDKTINVHKLYPENVPLALRMVEGAINPHEADLWHLRLFEYPKAKIVQQLDKGFVLRKHELTRDVIIEKNGVVAAWFNLLTLKADFCVNEQVESGIYSWGEEDVRYIRAYLSKMSNYNE